MAHVVAGVVDHPQLDLVAEDDQQRCYRQRNHGDGQKQQCAQAPAPESPGLGWQQVGAAKTLHEREHDAEARKDAEAAGGEHQLPGINAAREDVGLNQVKRVYGKKLVEDGAQLAQHGAAFLHLRHQRGDYQQSGKDHEHAGIRRGLGGVDHVVGQGLEDRFADFD